MMQKLINSPLVATADSIIVNEKDLGVSMLQSYVGEDNVE